MVIFPLILEGVNKMRLCLLLVLCLGSYYGSLKAEENFVIIDGATGALIQEFGSETDKRVSPACSFNIALSLMAYEAEVLQDKSNPTWDFQEGYDDFAESWKASQTPETWMTRSCLWFSKLISIQLGCETIKHYLSLFEYGNQDLSTGIVFPGPANPAWVSSSLKISPKEQVCFVQKMIRGELPLSTKSLEMTREILFKEEMNEGWQLFGKTGLGSTFGENNQKLKLRWFVGWLEVDDRSFPFAYLLQQDEVDILQTVPRVKQLLVEAVSAEIKKYEN